MNMKMTLNGKVHKSSLLLWILCLAFLSVGARNFERGLSVDGPLYGSISRHIAETGEWFEMDGQVPDFKPFYEHTHLGFWIQALVFKILPAEDWSARILGHVYYVLFLFFLFRWIAQSLTQKAACVAVLLLWLWPVVSNYFSNNYLDPGTLLLGSAGVWCLQNSLRMSHLKSAVLWGFTAGLCLGLCTIYKGLTVLGFGPAAAFLVFEAILKRSQSPKRVAVVVLSCLGLMLLPVLLYLLALKHSSVPNFMTMYFHRQWTGRFQQEMGLGAFFRADFWWVLLRNTHFIGVLSLWGMYRAFREKTAERVPAILLISFILMFAPANRIGYQYSLMLLPWVAWLVAFSLEPYLKFDVLSVMKKTSILSVTLVCVVQYLPFPTHKSFPPEELNVLRRLNENGHEIKKIIFDNHDGWVDFTHSAPFPWYGRFEIEYKGAEKAVPTSRREWAYLVEHRSSLDRQQLVKNGWCPHEELKERALWIACSQ